MASLALDNNQVISHKEEEKKLSNMQSFLLIVIGAFLLLAGMPEAIAFSAPSAGTPGYEVYDLVVNDVIKGPIGQAGGVFFMAKGSSELNQSPWKAGATILGGGMLFQAEALSTSFGYPLELLAM